jgi:hypothetical protein
MAKRERAQRNSITTQIEQFRSSTAPIEPVIPLEPAELIYFNQVINDRESTSWSTNHLSIACNLARTQVAIDRLWEQLKTEGYTLKNERGTPIANPALNALNTLTNTMQALNRTLGLSASQRGLAGSKQGERNKTDREVREINEATDAHQLLA